MLGGQHVGVPRSGGVSDTAHDAVLAARRLGLLRLGRMRLGLLRLCWHCGVSLRLSWLGLAGRSGGWPGWRGAGYIRLGAEMPSSRRPAARTVRAALASCSRAWMSSLPAGGPSPVPSGEPSSGGLPA